MNLLEYKSLFPIGREVLYQGKAWEILAGDWIFGDGKLFIRMDEGESSRSCWVDYTDVVLINGGNIHDNSDLLL